MQQLSLSFSDFPDGGATPSPISPVGESPFSFSSDEPVKDIRFQIEAALITGSRSKNFLKKISLLCASLPRNAADFGTNEISVIFDLAEKCRSKREILRAIGWLIKENDLPFCKLQWRKKKDRRTSEFSSDQKLLFDVFETGSRFRNFAAQVSTLCVNLPESRWTFSKEDIASLLNMAVKCRCLDRLFSVFGYKREEKVRVVRTGALRRGGRKKTLSAEQRRENQRQCCKKCKRKRLARDPGFKILCVLRKRLQEKLKGNKKANNTVTLLGCSVKDFVAHLEARWAPGMSWENYGIDGWHIDHIRPCASFDMSKKEDQLLCFHYTNMQPLWAKDNIAKGARYQHPT